jgi:GT2 family glycosyltransferase
MSGATAAVTVIVPAWGVSDLLPEALASLQSQTRTDWRAVVVDDGDTAAVAAAVAPFLADERIRLLATDNVGLAGARNRAIAAADTPFVALLDGDDRYRPDYLERMLPALEADPRIGFVTSDALLFGLKLVEGKLFSQLEPQHGPITLERVLTRAFKVFGAAAIRRTAIEEVGGYDASLRSAEDLDLWIRLLERGWAAVRVDAPMVEYRRRAASLSGQSLSLARWVTEVYERAAVRLEGRPEQACALAMLERSRNDLRIEEGVADILAGRSWRGVAQLRTTDLADTSPRWRMAMRLFRLFPPLARPMLRRYMAAKSAS